MIAAGDGGFGGRGAIEGGAWLTGRADPADPADRTCRTGLTCRTGRTRLTEA